MSLDMPRLLNQLGRLSQLRYLIPVPRCAACGLQGGMMHARVLMRRRPLPKERILNEAVSALEKAVTEQGLSVGEYDSILEVAQNDPGVREKIRQRIRGSTE